MLRWEDVLCPSTARSHTECLITVLLWCKSHKIHFATHALIRGLQNLYKIIAEAAEAGWGPSTTTHSFWLWASLQSDGIAVCGPPIDKSSYRIGKSLKLRLNESECARSMSNTSNVFHPVARAHCSVVLVEQPGSICLVVLPCTVPTPLLRRAAAQASTLRDCRARFCRYSSPTKH